MANKINIIALIAGITTLVLIAVSVYVPWWQFTVGTATAGKSAPVQVNFSPLNFNVNLFGSNSITVPLILAFNLICLLTLLSGALVLIIYAVKPNKSYSKKLLGFGWKKPLYAVILFVVEIVGLILVANMFGGLNLPINGSATVQPPSGMLPSGVNFGVSVLAAFQWPFYLSIVVAGLCVAARLYHRTIPLETAVPPATQPQYSTP
jgi:hypothetical protein